MRIALAGKGGTGKTTLAGTLSRLYGRAHRTVLALDADSNPNLATTLGLSPETTAKIRSVPGSLGEWRTAPDTGRAYVHLTLPLDEVIKQYGVAAPDGVTLLVMGTVDHAGVGCRCSAHAAARGIMGHLMQADAPIVISDMEAGLEHLGRGTVEHADALLILIEPYYRALEAGRRMKELAAELGVPRIYIVANKIRQPDEETAIRSFCEQHQLRLLATLPFDDSARGAEANGLSLLDAQPDSPLARGIADLAVALEENCKGVKDGNVDSHFCARA